MTTVPWTPPPPRIYLAECKRLKMLKIGASDSPSARCKGFRSNKNLPRRADWRIVGSFISHRRTEYKLHAILRAFRHPEMARGKEWYVDCLQVRRAFALLALGMRKLERYSPLPRHVRKLPVVSLDDFFAWGGDIREIEERFGLTRGSLVQPGVKA